MTTRIWTETGFVTDDPWIIETEETKAGGNEKPILSLADFLAAAEAGGEKLGVLIAPADDVTALAPHLGRIALVALSFPAFSDGRAFSHASLLRARLGFSGEVRAVGDVLIDQVPHMLRCGVDSFAVTNATALQRFPRGGCRVSTTITSRPRAPRRRPAAIAGAAFPNAVPACDPGLARLREAVRRREASHIMRNPCYLEGYSFQWQGVWIKWRLLSAIVII